MRRLAALVLTLAWCWPAAGTAPASGSVGVIAALEQAPHALVAVLEAPRALDDEAQLAVARVEQSLKGQTHPRVEIVWEERARSRPVRFAAGDRVLLALEPLPGHSIWRQRVPAAEQRARSLYVAQDGQAFARDPSLGGVLELQHFLRLPEEQRDRAPGVVRLALLAEGAEPPLALAALERLSAVPNLDAQLDAASQRSLVGALLRQDASDDQRERVLALIARGPLKSLRPALAALAQRTPLAPAPVFEALGSIDAALSPRDVDRLLAAKSSAPHRAAGARYASGAAARRLPALLKGDPSPSVRAAAVARWLQLEGIGGANQASPALRDSETLVRNAALLSLARLGPDAAPVLRASIESAPPEVARSAVAALTVAGGAASVKVLREVAESHPDEGVRMLARTALGEPMGHRD